MNPATAPSPATIAAAHELVSACITFPNESENLKAAASIQPEAWPGEEFRAFGMAARLLRDRGERAEVSTVLAALAELGLSDKLTALRLAEISNAYSSCNPERCAREITADYTRREYAAKVARLAQLAPEMEPHEFRLFLKESGLADGTAEASAFVDPTRWREVASEPIPWVIDGVIPDYCTTVLGAQGGVGKSALARGLALSIVLGKALFPSLNPTARGPVIVYSGEDSAQLYYKSIEAYERAHGLDREAVDDAVKNRLFLRCMSATPLLTLGNGGVPVRTPAFDEMRQTAIEIRPKLVIIDTLRKHIGLPDENSNGFVGAFLEACNDIARDAGCAVLVLHHSNKAGASSSDAKGNDLRGGSAAHDEARSVLILKKDESVLTLSHVKSNYGPMHQPMRFEFQGAALAEIGGGVRDLDDVIDAVVEWVSEHPQALTRGMVSRSQAAGKDFLSDIARRVPWAERDVCLKAINTALDRGDLIEVNVTKINGKNRLVLSVPEECENYE